MWKSGEGRDMFVARWKSVDIDTINFCAQVLECIGKISALEIEIREAGMIRQVLYSWFEYWVGLWFIVKWSFLTPSQRYLLEYSFMNIPIPNRDQIEEKARAEKGAVEEARERWSKNSTHLKLYLLSDEVT